MKIKNINYKKHIETFGKASYQLKTVQITNPAIRESKESIGYRILWLRNKLGLTQREFAAAIERKSGYKMTAKNISCYETERCVPKGNKMAALCKATGLNADFFEGATSKKYVIKWIKENLT